MKKLYAKIKSLTGGMAMDKVLHSLISFVTLVIVSAILSACNVGNDMIIYISVAVTLAIGALKELADKCYGGDASLQDFMADFIGVTIGVVFVFMLIV